MDKLISWLKMVGPAALLFTLFLSPGAVHWIDKNFVTDDHFAKTIAPLAKRQRIAEQAHHNDDVIYMLMVDTNSRLRAVEINELRESILLQEEHKRQTTHWSNDQQIRLDNNRDKLNKLIRIDVDYRDNYKSGLGRVIPLK